MKTVTALAGMLALASCGRPAFAYSHAIEQGRALPRLPVRRRAEGHGDHAVPAPGLSLRPAADVLNPEHLMKVSGKGVAELLSHEAMVTSPYRDSGGVWTIGVGHTAGAGKPHPQSMPKGIETPLAELVALFRSDLAKFEEGVSAAVKVKLAQHEFDALVSFHFNTGAISRASFVKKLNAGDRMGAAAGMLEWKKPAEIIGRRRKEMKLFRDGKYSNDGKCTIYPADRNGLVQWGSGRRVSVARLIAPEPVRASPAPAASCPTPAPKPPPAPAAAPPPQQPKSLLQRFAATFGRYAA